jgi:hypothetical protein
MTVYVVERELTGTMIAALTGLHVVDNPEAEGLTARFLRCVFKPVSGRFFCLYEGANAEDVRRYNDDRGLPYKSIRPDAECLPAA